MLSAKYAEGNLFVIDSVETPSHRTRDLLESMSKWPAYQAGKRILVIFDEHEVCAPPP